MGAWGAIIMSFFGALFAALTFAFQLHWRGPALGLPFLGFAIIALAAAAVIRRPGEGVTPSPRVEKVIMWSSIGEGIGLPVAATLMTNLGHPELLLPAMAIVVGLHFLPIAYAASFTPFYLLAAAALWAASIMAVRRDSLAKAAGERLDQR